MGEANIKIVTENNKMNFSLLPFASTQTALLFARRRGCQRERSVRHCEERSDEAI